MSFINKYILQTLLKRSRELGLCKSHKSESKHPIKITSLNPSEHTYIK